jgi:hypothetical protein
MKELTDLLWDGFKKLSVVGWDHSTIQFKDVSSCAKQPDGAKVCASYNFIQHLVHKHHQLMC